MQPAIADLVHPIFAAGISLRERLDAKESLRWDHERDNLRLLLSTLKSTTFHDANQGNDAPFDFATSNDSIQANILSRTTIRYALTTWLDEFIGQQSAWGARWRNDPFEPELFQSRSGASKFWDEARYAQTRGDLDTLEVMYLCVMLGFRGDLHSKPHQLEAWAKRVRDALRRNAPAPAMPASLAPPTRDAALPDNLRYRGAMFALILGLTLVAPLATLMVLRLLNV